MKSNKKYRNLNHKRNKIDNIHVNNVIKFLKRNNSMLYHSYKLSLHNMLISEYFNKMYDGSNQYTLQEKIEKLREIQGSLKIMYKYYKGIEQDFRPGIETYGYDSEESIESNLYYISDRWTCAFRIKWLLDLIKL